MHAIRALLAFLCSSCLVEAAASGEFDASLYDPIEPGQYSTFRLNGQLLETDTVLPGFEDVNGVLTRVVETTGGPDSGFRSNETNDEFGIRTHRLFIPNIVLPGIPRFDRTATFSPPVRDLFESFDLGETVRSQGDVLIVDSDGYSITLTFDQTTVVGGVETITAPFGTFEAIRIDQRLVTSDGSRSETDVQTVWVAAGLGSLRTEATVDGETDLFELWDTNRVFVPEPESAILQLFALSTLAFLSAGRRRTRTDTCPTACFDAFAGGRR